MPIFDLGDWSRSSATFMLDLADFGSKLRNGAAERRLQLADVHR